MQFIGSDPVGLLSFVVENLVKNPEYVDITPVDNISSMIFELRVHESDLGPVIGRSGRNARLIRTLLNSLSSKKVLLSEEDVEERVYSEYTLEIIED